MKKRRGEIILVKDLFLKYRRLLQAPQKTVELSTIKVVGELLNIKLKEEQISYTVNTRTLAIKAPGILKQEILLKQVEIKSRLKDELGEKNAPKTII